MLATPFDNLLATAGKLQPSEANLKKIERLNTTQGVKILLLDLSGSMAEYVGDQRKVDILQCAIQGICLKTFGFNSSVFELYGTLPEPAGGTGLHLAIKHIRKMQPMETLIVSDGLPDSEEQALAAAQKLTGMISTLYIGSDSNHKAIDFMNRLARLGCGISYAQDLQLGSYQLSESIRSLMPAS
jgi:hypothetical protein